MFLPIMTKISSFELMIPEIANMNYPGWLKCSLEPNKNLFNWTMSNKTENV